MQEHVAVVSGLVRTFLNSNKVMKLKETQDNNPLHGVTLEKIVTDLQAHFGWEELAFLVNINCFKKDPSVKSSLKFLRRTPWARDKVEALYINTFY